MILKEFAKYLHENDENIYENKTTATKLLCEWIKTILKKHPKSNVEKVVHTEIMLAENNTGDFLIVGKSESGRALVKSLGYFAESYENCLIARWLENRKPNDFC